MEPASPALEGGLFTTGPPGKSLLPVFEISLQGIQVRPTGRETPIETFLITNQAAENRSVI